ncbi:AAA family ATPase [Rhodococcus sovatensis]|uniref:AAA family ATPase n=1 Tax=Rhodococcus sovatensis TaxID=1805840 RepID=A0ABZ2PPC9_9NOCA
MTDDPDFAEKIMYTLFEQYEAEAKSYNFRYYDGDDSKVPPFLNLAKASKEAWLVIGKKFLAAKTPDDLPHWLHTAYGGPWRSLQHAIDTFHRSADPVKDGFDDFAEESRVYAETQKYVTRELAKVQGRMQLDAEKNADMLATFDAAWLVRDQLDLLPDPVPLVPGMLYQQTLALLVAAPKSFKSFLALSWSCSVATGTPWLSRDVDQGGVLYMVGEGALGVKKRVAAWETYHGVRAEALTLFTETFDLGVEESIPFQRFLDRAIELRPKLIVVDTLNRYAAGHDENSAAEMAIVIVNLTRLVNETGASVLLVHHATKAGDKTGRGSSALFAAADASFFLDRRNPKGLAVALETTKSKDDAEGDPLPLRMEPSADSLVVVEGDPFEDDDSDTEAAADLAVLTAVMNQPGLPKREYSRGEAAPGSIGRRDAEVALARLENTGRIHAIPGPKRAKLMYPGPRPLTADEPFGDVPEAPK